MFGVSKTGYSVMCVRSVLLKQDGLHGVAGTRYPNIGMFSMLTVFLLI